MNDDYLTDKLASIRAINGGNIMNNILVLIEATETDSELRERLRTMSNKRLMALYASFYYHSEQV